MLSQPGRRSSDFVASPRPSRDIRCGACSHPQILRYAQEDIDLTAVRICAVAPASSHSPPDGLANERPRPNAMGARSFVTSRISGKAS